VTKAEKFADIKGILRSHYSKKDRQYNDQRRTKVQTTI